MLQHDELTRMESFRTFCINLKLRMQNSNDPMSKCRESSEIMYLEMLISHFDGIIMGARG